MPVIILLFRIIATGASQSAPGGIRKHAVSEDVGQSKIPETFLGLVHGTCGSLHLHAPCVPISGAVADLIVPSKSELKRH